jgi:hypothetical protein
MQCAPPVVSSWGSRTPSRRCTAASRTATTSAGRRARRDGRVGQRVGEIIVGMEVGKADRDPPDERVTARAQELLRSPDASAVTARATCPSARLTAT